MQGSKLYVGNLSYSVTTEELTALFAQYGQVTQVNIIEGRGFGFIEMSSPNEAEKAKEALHDTEFKGRPLKIDEARPRQDRPRGGGRSGGGGGRGPGRSGGGGGGGGRGRDDRRGGGGPPRGGGDRDRSRRY